MNPFYADFILEAIEADRAKARLAAIKSHITDVRSGASSIHRFAISSSRGRQTPDVLIAATTVGVCESILRAAQ